MNRFELFASTLRYIVASKAQILLTAGTLLLVKRKKL